MDENITIENEEIIEDDQNEFEVIDGDSEDEDYEPSLGETLVGIGIVALPLAAAYAIGVASGDTVKAGWANLKEKHEVNKQKRKAKFEAFKNAHKKPQLVEVVDSTEDETEN
jgi:hypothetical protein